MLPGTLTPSIKVSSSSRRKVPHAGGYSLSDSLRTYRSHVGRQGEKSGDPPRTCPTPIFAPTHSAECAPTSRTGSQTPTKLASSSCPTPPITEGETEAQKEKRTVQTHHGRAGPGPRAPSEPGHYHPRGALPQLKPGFQLLRRGGPLVAGLRFLEEPGLPGSPASRASANSAIPSRAASPLGPCIGITWKPLKLLLPLLPHPCPAPVTLMSLVWDSWPWELFF